MVSGEEHEEPDKYLDSIYELFKTLTIQNEALKQENDDLKQENKVLKEKNNVLTQDNEASEASIEKYQHEQKQTDKMIRKIKEIYDFASGKKTITTDKVADTAA